MNTRFSVCRSLLLLLILLRPIATAAKDDNLLPNGSFEEIFEKRVRNTKANNGPHAAAKHWRQFINDGNRLITQVIRDRELAVDGEHVIDVTADGAGSGVSMFYLVGNLKTVTYSAWIYVRKGKVGIAVGSNAKGFFWAHATKHKEWEFLEVTVDGAAMPEQVLIYSQRGAADFYADAAWVNFGEKTTNPITTLQGPKAVDARQKLAMTWGKIKAQNQ